MSSTPSFTLIRASRRTLSLQISAEKWLIVRAPFSMPEDIIHAFVEKKSDWIMKHLSGYQDTNAHENKSLYYLGQTQAIEYHPLQKESLLYTDWVFTFSGHIRDSKREWATLEKWYRKEAKLHMTERVAYFSKQYNLQYQGVTITWALTRWGSCSGRNRLSFPWRLMMAPREVIDYVVVHELAHTVHKDHSLRFWKLVESITPDWEIYRAHLRKEGWKYTLSRYST